MFRITLFLLLFLNHCFFFDPKPCNCKDGDDKTSKVIALHLLYTEPMTKRASTYSCNVSGENLCYELQNYLARRSNGSFCISIAGTYSENSCNSANRIGSCYLPETSNLKKNYYSPIWSKASSQADCTNLKGTWIE